MGQETLRTPGGNPLIGVKREVAAAFLAEITDFGANNQPERAAAGTPDDSNVTGEP
jgi:hypothetical protein